MRFVTGLMTTRKIGGYGPRRRGTLAEIVSKLAHVLMIIR